MNFLQRFYHKASLASALVPLISPLALERVAQPTVNAGSAAMQIKTKETDTRLNCVNGALNQSVMTCPQDCMIPTTNVSVTTVDICDVSTASSWTCKWPTQWVTEQEDCNNLGFGSGWAGMATVRREYEIQQCGQVVVPTGKPLQLIDVSQCSRNRNETDTKPCPTRDNYYLGAEIGGSVGESWRKAASYETNWAGAGVNLTRPLVEGLSLAGAVETRSQGDWSVSSVQCQRQHQRTVTLPCDGSQVEVCITPAPASPTIVVTTTTVMINGTPRQVTRTIEIPPPPPTPVCTMEPGGSTDAACITDYKPGSISFEESAPVFIGYNPYGQPMYRRNWSYTASKSVYSTNCRGAVTGNSNSGVAVVTVGLDNTLISPTVLSALEPVLLQSYCSRSGMNRGWTTYEYGNMNGDSDSDGDGDGCGCDGNDSDSDSDSDCDGDSE